MNLSSYPKPQSPEELHSLFGKYFTSKDLNGLASLFDENAVFVIDKKGSLAKGREAILEQLKGFLDGAASMQTIATSIHINNNIALIKSQWKISGTDVSGTALEVMQYKNGGWVYIIDNPSGF